MIKNYVTDDDLMIRYPNLHNQLWRTQADYTLQIRKGFDRVLNDLHNMSINARQCMIPLDMLAPLQQSTVPNQEVAQLTISGANQTYLSEAHGGSFAPLVGWGQYGLPYVSGPGQFVQEYYQNVYINLNQRRMVAKLWTPVTGSFTIKIQGNNVQTSPTNTGVPDPIDANWRDIDDALLSFTTCSIQNTEFSKVFYTQYRWYRAKVEGTGVMTYSVWTVENIFDDLITSSALIYILRDFVKEDGDQWSIRLKHAQDDYDQALTTLKFMFDLNDDGIMTTDDEEKRSGTITLVR